MGRRGDGCRRDQWDWVGRRRIFDLASLRNHVRPAPVVDDIDRQTIARGDLAWNAGLRARIIGAMAI